MKGYDPCTSPLFQRLLPISLPPTSRTLYEVSSPSTPIRASRLLPSSHPEGLDVATFPGLSSQCLWDKNLFKFLGNTFQFPMSMGFALRGISLQMRSTSLSRNLSSPVVVMQMCFRVAHLRHSTSKVFSRTETDAVREHFYSTNSSKPPGFLSLSGVLSVDTVQTFPWTSFLVAFRSPPFRRKV